ncbi:hypothetical protein Q5H91_10575 [Sphingomonas sp. KR1UV-12]|uniref:Uncharacterized protein n=1 Tax=Sphingomonas aurea TaxID=3063994 RepID=A0ABT9EL32_9SPHN|nr:hypothetical protein [Sphingomonas sp. KR1UV-12]MDP1027659.1 hypothetical protein [Sphingomonas sp. KR1UV-12]
MLARLLSLALLAWGVPAAAAETPAIVAPVASDAELATMTGKFLLPGGGSLALSVTSDTLVNGALVLRTVLTVDQGSNLTVFGRTGDAEPMGGARSGGGTENAATPTMAGGVSVLFDRRTGTQIVMPSVGTVRGTTGGAQPVPAGVVPLVLTAGGPAVATADGTVTLTQLPNGSRVSLAGDQIDITHLVGQSVATAISNAGNDRTIDTVTTIGIDLHDATALAMGAAAMKVDALVSDVARGMVR